MGEIKQVHTDFYFGFRNADFGFRANELLI